MPLPNFKKRIDALAAFDFGATQLEAVRNNENVLLDMQAEQFAQGKDKNDNEILLEGRGYTFGTIMHKRLFGVGLGRVTDHVTLFYTGALYKNLFMTITAGNFTISSRVSYFNKLMTRTGDVTGINKENRLEFAQGVLLPYVSMKLQAATGFKITSKTRIIV